MEQALSINPIGSIEDVEALYDNQLLALLEDNGETLPPVTDGVNASWVLNRIAEEAYDRNLIDAQRMDWITR
jgi:hypothetical protein